MKQALRLPFFALVLVCLCAAGLRAQTPSPTPDPSVTQITSSLVDSFARDISGDGRFVVIESNGDIATLPPGQTATTKSPNNADGNREIFLFDFAQRRIFQITDTKSALKDATLAIATRFLSPNIQVEVSNNRPMISRDGKWIVFSSNAFNQNDNSSSPFSFDGDVQTNEDALKADGNQEVFLYRIPDVGAADLTSGTTPAYQDLRQGTVGGVSAFTRATNTPASSLPRAGTSTSIPFVADDNRAAQINDDGSRVVFVSTRNLQSLNLGRLNADGSPEIFVYNNVGGGSISQITVTSLDQNLLVFADNPNISGSGATNATIAFTSNAKDLRFTNSTDAASNVAAANSDGDNELFVASYNGATVTSMRQATRTKRQIPADVVNYLNPGRRLSRDGNLVAFESVAADPKADNSTTNETNNAIFVYNISADSFTQVGPRAVSTGTGAEFEDVLRFPTFAGDNSRVFFTSNLNLKADGTRVAQADAAGLNPARLKQIFSATVPASGSTATSVTRLTNLTGNDAGGTMQPYLSNTQERLAFSLAAYEFGTGNSDQANEAYYLLTPPAPSTADVPAASSALAFFTGATRRDVITPAASPTPTPSPTPSTPPVTGLAPGMLGIVRTTSSSITFSATSQGVCPADTPGCDAASESAHRPTLPVELNGVSLSINGAAAGLYFVSASEIQFVVPPGLVAQTGSSTYPVTINIRETGGVRTVRSTLQVIAAQPDIFSSTGGAGGRAAVTNVTNPLLAVGTSEPFNVTTTFVNSSGTSVTAPTVLRVVLTGVRGVAKGAITVRLTKGDNTTVDLTGDAIPRDAQATDMPGVFTIDFTLPATLAGAGDVSITVIASSIPSRPADTAPRFRIN
ncbi:MAG: hypothetical protein ACJ741_10100 [Pyrinomonadaceae bacterium]